MAANCPNKKGAVRKRSIIGRFFNRLSLNPLLLVVIVALLSIIGTTLISMLLVHSGSGVYLPSFATIQTVDVEVYWDPNCENKTELLCWDDLEVGSSVNMTVYVKSVSNVPITLNMNITDWNPEKISDYLTFSSDYHMQEFSPQEVIPVTLTLSASSSDEFTYYIVENLIQTFDFAVHFVGSN